MNRLLVKGIAQMAYRLWLLADESGQITLTGWSEPQDEAAGARADHWPVYPLSCDRAQLPNRLAELGLDLDVGAALDDLDRQWDCYVRHPDVGALRAQLDKERVRA